MKRFSTSKSQKHYYNWYRGGDKYNASKVKKYKMTPEEISQIEKRAKKMIKGDENPFGY